MLLTLVLLFTSLAIAADTAAWRSRNIYFALTDRVARSDTDNGGSACGNLGNYCGGTFKGLESKLDYISGMGFDAIWITPVVKNSPRGYHGYWAQDLYAVNENYGTAEDLKSLVDTAHEKGIFIMADVVANHMGQGAISDNRPTPLNDQSSYHRDCDIDYSNQTSVEVCRIAGLPDLNTGKPEIRKLLQDWVKWLVTEFGFDGIRIDTVKHVEHDFWPAFSEAAGVYSVGEVWDGNAKFVASYADGMSGLLNYPIYFPMKNFYQQKGSAQAIVSMHSEIDSAFPDPTALATFLDNHDNERWLHQKNDVSLLKNNLAYVLLARGIPIVYYGTEQGYSGGADPNNREDLWRSSFSTSTDLYRTVSLLSGARTSAGGLPDDDHVHLHATNNAYAWSRAGGDLIVFTSNTGAGTGSQYCFNAQRANGAWSSVLSSGSDTVTSDSSGNLCVQVSNGEPVVLIASNSNGGGDNNNGTMVPTASSTLAASSSVSPSSSSATSTACPTSVSVTFSARVRTQWGDTIRVAGNAPELGSWEPLEAPALTAGRYTEEDPVWSGEVDLPAGKSVEWKLLNVRSDGSVSWESDPNRGFDVPACEASVDVEAEWR